MERGTAVQATEMMDRSSWKEAGDVSLCLGLVFFSWFGLVRIFDDFCFCFAFCGDFQGYSTVL